MSPQAGGTTRVEAANGARSTYHASWTCLSSSWSSWPCRHLLPLFSVVRSARAGPSYRVIRGTPSSSAGEQLGTTYRLVRPGVPAGQLRQRPLDPVQAIGDALE